MMNGQPPYGGGQANQPYPPTPGYPYGGGGAQPGPGGPQTPSGSANQSTFPDRQWSGQEPYASVGGYPPVKAPRPLSSVLAGAVTVMLALVLAGSYLVWRQHQHEPTILHGPTAAPPTSIAPPSEVPTIGGPTEEPSADYIPAPPMSSSPVYPKGETFTIGDWEYTVLSVQEATSIGSGYSLEPVGKFVVTRVTMKNISTSPAMIYDSYFQATDGTTQYYPDAAAWIVLDDGLLLESLDPGQSVTRSLAFDVPKNVTLTGLAASGGIAGPWAYSELN